jgi:hypothetical protein
MKACQEFDTDAVTFVTGLQDLENVASDVLNCSAVYDRAVVAFDGKNRAVIDRAYSLS